MSYPDTTDELIANLVKNPAHYGVLENPTFVSVGKNRLCGDRVFLSLLCEGWNIQKIAFQTTGCVLSRAASELTANLCESKTFEEVLALREEDVLSALGIEISLRKQCALLALFTVKEGLLMFLKTGAVRSEHLLVR